MRFVFKLSIVLMCGSFAGVLVLAFLPLLLKHHEYRLRCVCPRFQTPAEQYELAARATQHGDLVFGALYDSKMNEVQVAYVPPKGSLTYFILRAVNFGGSIATKEDFLPAPPAPMAFEFIDEEKATPFTMSEYTACRMELLMTLSGFGILCGVVALLTQLAGERPPKRAQMIG